MSLFHGTLRAYENFLFCDGTLSTTYSEIGYDSRIDPYPTSPSVCYNIYFNTRFLRQTTSARIESLPDLRVRAPDGTYRRRSEYDFVPYRDQIGRVGRQSGEVGVVWIGEELLEVT